MLSLGLKETTTMTKKIGAVAATLAVLFVTLATPLKALANPPWVRGDVGVRGNVETRQWQNSDRNESNRHFGWFNGRNNQDDFRADRRYDTDDFRANRYDDKDNFRAYRYQRVNPYNGYSTGTYTPYYSSNSSLLYAQQSAQVQYQAALARGDRRGAKHLANALRKLNGQVGAQGYFGLF